MSDEPTLAIYASSPDVARYVKLFEQVAARLHELTVGMSFALPLGEYSTEDMFDVVRSAAKRGCAYVVVKHGEAVEVARLPDGAKTFIMKRRDVSASHDDAAVVNSVRRILSEYGTVDFYAVDKYRSVTETMFRQGCVTKTYLMRRLTGLASVRKHPHGAKDAIDAAIERLCMTGALTLLDREEREERFGTTATIYAINKISA